MKKHLSWGAVLTLLSVGAHAQATEEVTVQSGRLAQKQFDAPASLKVIDGEAIRNAGAQVNLSEALAQAPGVVALNRNNYAQDVQISIRGFGARAAFGLRGIRLITDGIPATTPDGQGQASTVSLTSAERIEVLTGPLAQLYGNSAGGVIQTFTREAGAQPEAQVSSTMGRYGLRRNDVQLSGRAGNVGIVADYSTFDIAGYRSNSAAQRKQFNAVVTTQLQDATRLKLIANVFDMPEAQDPLGLTADQLKTNPTQAGTGAIANRTRKAVKQNQVGAVLDHNFGNDLEMQWRAYTGTRENTQFQASASWVGLNRSFYGLGGQLKGKVRDAANGPVDWVVGFDADQSSERRQGGANNAASEKDLTKPLTRNDLNQANNRDIFAQVNWHWTDAQGHNPYTLTGGVRRSQVQLKNTDDLNNGVSSGQVDYAATLPVLGVTWHALETLNVYANWGKGFETPTLAEAAYVTDANTKPTPGFNSALLASRSQHSELGLKWTPSMTDRIGAALFHITTENEIVTRVSNTGQTVFVNAPRTLRQGAELTWDSRWSANWKSLVSMAWVDATYDSAFNTQKYDAKTKLPVLDKSIAAGNHLPGIPAQQLFASLQWAQQGFAQGSRRGPGGLLVSADWVARSGLWASDMNDGGSRVDGYGLLNVRARYKFDWGPAQIETWAGVENLMDRRYVGSVIVNQSAAVPQYFEPGLPRNAMVGVKLSLPL